MHSVPPFNLKPHKPNNFLEGTNYYDLAFHSNSASNASFHTVEVWNRNDDGDSFQLVCLGIIKVHFKAALATHSSSDLEI